MNKRVNLTPQGLKALQEEYQELVNKKRPVLLKKIEALRSLGDLSENESYRQARREQGFMEGRILDLEAILKRTEVIKNNSSAQIGLGSRVRVRHSQEEHEFILVEEIESDPAQGRISQQSPLGTALVGRAVGETVEVEAPTGKIFYKIMQIE